MKDIQYFQEIYPIFSRKISNILYKKYSIFYIKNIQYFQEMNKIFSKSLD